MLLLAAFVAATVGGISIIIARRSASPALTAERFAAAQAKWEAAGPASYEIEIDVRGAQPALYTVTVERGEPVSAARNSTPLKQRRTWETWSVPGMFDTVASDVAALNERSNLVVRCEFDPEFGFPAKYERIEMGTGQQVRWEVKRFERP